MITLKDRIEICTTPGDLFTWLSRMPIEYRAWHPDHVSCRVIHGSFLEAGAEIECEEYLHGKLHKMTFRMTKVIPDRRVEYVIKGIGSGAFEAEPIGDKVRFTAELEFGSRIPVIGLFFDWMFGRVFHQRLEAMKRHMVEEGRNLKVILESNLPSARGRKGQV